MANIDLDKLIETLNKIRDNAINEGDSCDYIDYIDETIAFVRSKHTPVMQEGKDVFEKWAEDDEQPEDNWDKINRAIVDKFPQPSPLPQPSND